jgi:hypothetical protein
MLCGKNREYLSLLNVAVHIFMYIYKTTRIKGVVNFYFIGHYLDVVRFVQKLKYALKSDKSRVQINEDFRTLCTASLNIHYNKKNILNKG